jgi:hypothetical protein
MQFRTQIPPEAVPGGIVWVQTDVRPEPVPVRIPLQGQVGDVILFDWRPSSSGTKKKNTTTTTATFIQKNNSPKQTNDETTHHPEEMKPLTAYLESPTTNWWCCPHGIVASEWVIAFVLGLWVRFGCCYCFPLSLSLFVCLLLWYSSSF